MRKFVCVLALFAVTTLAAVAEIAQMHFEIPASESEFNVDFIELKGMKAFRFPKQDDMYVTRAYKVKSHGKEGVMTYSLFKDTGVPGQDMKTEVFLWTRLCTLNVTGWDDIPQPTFFGDDDVKGEFNGTCGTTNILAGPFKNAFLKDYAYAAIDSFYKKGQGLVIRVSMSKDIGFFGRTKDGSFAGMEAPYFDFYDSFKFRDIHHFTLATADDDMAIACNMLDGMKETKWRKQKALPVSNAFELRSRNMKGVMTLSFFKDTGVSEENYRDEVLAFTKKCLLDITGVPEEKCPVLQWGPGGDGYPFVCSLSALVHGNFGTDFLKGYEFFQLESFYVKGEGLAVRVFLANDAAFFGFNKNGEFETSECPANDFYPSLRIRE